MLDGVGKEYVDYMLHEVFIYTECYIVGERQVGWCRKGVCRLHATTCRLL